MTNTNDVVNYDALTGSINLNGSTLNSLKTLTSGTYTHYWGDYYPYYPTVTTVYRDIVYQESKFDQAFRVAEKLMEKGHIKELPVKKFIELVKEVAETL